MVRPAQTNKFHNAKVANADSVELWGTGTARREFMYVDDMAQACLFVMGLDLQDYQTHTTPMGSHINVGTGEDVKIAELAQSIATIVDYKGELTFDAAKPDGAPRKLLDVSRLKSMGWSATTSLEQGLQQTYDWFLANKNTLRDG